MIALFLAAMLIPDRIDFDPQLGRTTPFWVRDAAAFTADGRIRPELFDQSYEETMEEHARQQPSRGDDVVCRIVSVQVCHEGNPPTLDDTIAVVSGKVVERAYGFMNGAGTTLVRLDVESVQKASPLVDTQNGLFLVFEHAAFRVAGRTFCSDSSAGALPPTLGAHVTVYIRHKPFDAEHRLILPTYPREVVVVGGEPKR